MDKLNWIITDEYLVGNYQNLNLNNNSKLAIFDLDHTLIKPKSNEMFPKNENDWQFFDEYVINNILNLSKKGYDLIIITNQKNLNGHNQLLWRTKLENIVKLIKLPLFILVSLKDDLFRKPRINLFEKIINIKFDKKNSFYCGDAGGLKKRRINNVQIRADFSDCDSKFASNLGIKFIHRDEFIFGQKYDSEDLIIRYPINFNKIEIGKYNFIEQDQDVILNVGYPASGKSYYSKKMVINKGYSYINQDTLKTLDKCLEEFESCLSSKKNIIVDNTNPSKLIRNKYIKLAKKYNYKIRCFYFNTSKELSNHNNIYRNIISNGQIKIIPKIAYNIYKKNFEMPTEEEGFNNVETIDFKLYENSINKKIYFSYLY
ncbi:3 phosphatase [uncultured virus]|nr:3 phosphatase [uncultured virus]